MSNWTSAFSEQDNPYFVAPDGKQHELYEVAAKLNALEAQVAELEKVNDRQSDALHRVESWCEAYPLDVFPEPDWRRVKEALEAAGLKLDTVSASNMRHVITQVGLICREAMSND